MHVVKLFFVLALSIGCGALTPAVAQLSLNSPGPDLPEVHAWVVGPPPMLDQAGNATFRINVAIPPDHHGYLDTGDEGFYIPLAFTFQPLEEWGAHVVPIARPAGTWDDKVHATVLRGQGEFAFRLETPNTAVETGGIFSATLRHQICNDITNICYAPKTVAIPLTFAAHSAPQERSTPLGQTSAVAPAALTFNERLTASFQHHMTHLSWAFLLVFAAGLLSAATPCVYPVIPITSAILMARAGGSRSQGRWHALVYFAGIIFFYALLGFFAATTGTALSALMTSAWVNIGFAVMFAYFGLSMLGLYEFQFLSTWSTKLDSASSRWHGFSGTFAMGTTAGLVVSPCVGPISGAILLEITSKAASTGSAMAPILRGLTLMTSFGAGLGVPFLVVGLLSNRLPRSGTWLTKIKWLLGLPILYFAYIYYLKGTDTAGIPTNVAQAILIGIVAIGLAVWSGALHSLDEKPSQHLIMQRVCGIVLLIIGIHFLYNGLGQSGILIPSRGTGQLENVTPMALSSGLSNPVPSEVTGNLHWLRDFPLAQQRASTEQKPVFVDFYATWCANCKAFQRLAVNNAQLNTALQQAVLVKIYDTDTLFRTFQADERYPELGGVGGQPFLPLFAIYSPQGKLIWKGQDYQAVATMVTQLEQAAQTSTP